MSNGQYPQPYPGYGYAPPAPPTQQQKLLMMVSRIKQLRSDLTTAFNPYSLQKIMDATLEIFEYLIAGSVTHPNPNQTPGKVLDPLEQGQARVEFYGAPQPQPQPPQQPVTNGDVQFTRHAPGAGGAVGGQTVEFYASPPGTMMPGTAQPIPPNFDRNGQKVEYFSAPPGGIAQPTQQVPMASAPPAGNPINSPSASQLVPGRPPVSVEAGYAFPPDPGFAPVPAGLPHAPAFAEQMNAQGRPMQAPQSREDLLSMLPIPLS